MIMEIGISEMQSANMSNLDFIDMGKDTLLKLMSVHINPEPG